ncbi:Heat shock protein 9/12 [Lasiodiplodia theobromae]|uniref:12 kDa heat shock protein n=1 Tax=Lasiodiplodia theobromae TaxID=45133 RepID=A0A5N5DD32_9PEZI|nr:Heat shock protein awh11 [Lasiodiplodia theobromae]KAB2575763.1 12 kDa heat shock protein [Lasiodiplodia theobromae]KAF4539535.1 Heat shock protein awh11 [Lasiodiplodia theobromae]KAF9639349.1 Heat shock protein 9/12 [Lasiodiplodia theobromae]
MSDAGRKSTIDQAKEKVTPDSQKSTLDQAKESLTGTYDRAAGAVQPDDQKSYTQKASDNLRSGSDDASKQSKSYMESAQETVGNAAQSLADTIGGKK